MLFEFNLINAVESNWFIDRSNEISKHISIGVIIPTEIYKKD